MSKTLKFLIYLIIFIVVLAVVRFVIGGPEDTWICNNGQWVKHGSPSASMPTEVCK